MLMQTFESPTIHDLLTGTEIDTPWRRAYGRDRRRNKRGAVGLALNTMRMQVRA